MNKHRYRELYAVAAVAIFTAAAGFAANSGGGRTRIEPATMPRIGTVSDRFLSYNIEMLEVTGGKFWKPYSAAKHSGAKPKPRKTSTPAAMSADLYQYRPPINLANPRLRKLAAALGPAYVRVSGTWANTTYFNDTNGPAPSHPPAGFNGVLTRNEWKSVVDFAHAVNAQIITSFATSAGTRNAAGVWTPGEASKFLAYTSSIGGNIAAAEFMNEPTFAAMGGTPKGYDAASFGRDLKVFIPFMRKAAPHTIILGPGSVGEGGGLAPPPSVPFLKTEALLQAAGPVFDAFSYHFYGAVSERCAAMGAGGTTPADALSNDWLSRTDKVEAYYAALRDRFEPGRLLWLTETGDAACGGNPWAATFLDSFRYLNQLGTLAQRGVQVVAHNTLNASDYGLLDEKTLEPRPNYWAALLWHRLMGTTVLNPGASPSTNLHLYAQCERYVPGGVTLLAINADRTRSEELSIAGPADRYTLTAGHLQDKRVQLNGKELTLGNNDALPALTGAPVRAGQVTLAPASISFFTFGEAGNTTCK